MKTCHEMKIRRWINWGNSRKDYSIQDKSRHDNSTLDNSRQYNYKWDKTGLTILDNKLR